MFELLVTLCLSTVCAERVLPAAMPTDKAQCEASMNARSTGWVKAHEGYRVKGQRCVAIETLDDRAAKTTETSPGHFVHEGLVEPVGPKNAGDIANTGFIVGDKAVAVIDAGSSRKVAEALYLAVRSKTQLPIRYLLLTHMHPDHTLGAEVFKEAGAEIVGSAALQQAMASRAEAYTANLKRLLGDDAFHGTKIVLSDRGVADSETIDLGQRELELRAHPTAHTNNDLTIYDKTSSTVWMGDLVFLTHTPALDGSIVGWIKLLSELRKNGAKHMVPGHGPGRAAYPDGAKPTLGYLTSLAQQTRKAIKAGESLNTALKHIGQDLRGDWKEFDEFNPRNATSAYVELEWE
ncbi:MAG: quinoprotein relay system zinc metallohydrolase 2 [Alphaproteobacteria bacterium]|nr:quinoprotein relay system zinc metallohydrolase 2 [Alphaproteobacteria bacterium]